MRSVEFYRWLHDCQLDSAHEYYHGWSDSRDFLIELEGQYPSFDFSVPETFKLTTPPPSSEVPMPVVLARSSQQMIAFVENWNLAPYFTVSIRRQFSTPVQDFGILSPIGSDQPWLLRHLPPQLRFGPFSPDAREFTAAVLNRHMLFALFHLMQAHETSGSTGPNHCVERTGGSLHARFDC
jgi:hypothetical protein